MNVTRYSPESQNEKSHWAKIRRQKVYSHTLIDEMCKQGQDIAPENFLCASCKNYKGALSCEKGLFIAFEGANLSHCSYFVRGRRCSHCGKPV